MKSLILPWLLLMLIAALSLAFPPFPDEEVYDTKVHGDEEVVNIVVASHRWPNCNSNRTAVRDMFRIEGAKTQPEKAMALWKWFRILVSRGGVRRSGGGYVYEGSVVGKEEIVHDPYKIFAVYGHHMCDGQSWALAGLWRAAGYAGFDLCHWGHTIASLRYKDDDGHFRFHDFDPNHNDYYWNGRRVATWTIPVMYATVHRHLLHDTAVHTGRTSLRTGETIERNWDNNGHVIIAGRDMTKHKIAARERDRHYYPHYPGRTDGVYAIAGEEVQVFKPDLTPDNYSRTLYPGSKNIVCAKPGKGRPALHPKAKKKTGVAIYRIPSPYVGVEGWCEAILDKGARSDRCRLSLSTDGKSWKTIYNKKKIGRQKVRIDLGSSAREKGKPHIYTAYAFYLKCEFSSKKDPRKVGLNGLKVKVHRELNKRTLPNLLPGENILRVTADSMAPDRQVELEINYLLEGQPNKVVQRIRKFPHYFKIKTKDVPPHVPSSYDAHFNIGALRMQSLKMKVVPLEAGSVDASMPKDRAEKAFKQSCPHPADVTILTDRKKTKAKESDPMETSGFFPQSKKVSKNKKRYAQLIKDFKANTKEYVDVGNGLRKVPPKWLVAEELGQYPEAVGILCDSLEKASIDLTLFIVKALAQIADPKAVGPLLEKWKMAPKGSPGTRYIPDALAAIGDTSVVPALVKPLHSLRFDYRLHIAYALSILNTPLAKQTLKELAENDPFNAVREFAQEALK